MPARAAALLREAGHDATTVLEQGLGGVPDETVATACDTEERVLVTLDLDFADKRTYGSSDSPGPSTSSSLETGRTGQPSWKNG